MSSEEDLGAFLDMWKAEEPAFRTHLWRRQEEEAIVEAAKELEHRDLPVNELLDGYAAWATARPPGTEWMSFRDWAEAEVRRRARNVPSTLGHS